MHPRLFSIRIPAGRHNLDGDLSIPNSAQGVVIFAHGSGSSRHSPRNRFVASVLQQAGLATLLLDLLTAEEETIDERTAELRFDIGLLAERLLQATQWVAAQSELEKLNVGYFGASTGAAAALVAAAAAPQHLRAVVSRGGRPDLAGPALEQVAAPTLLIVGGADGVVIELNREALRHLHCLKELKIIPGATHLFEQPGALETVARFAREWFEMHLAARQPGGAPGANTTKSSETGNSGQD